MNRKKIWKVRKNWQDLESGVERDRLEHDWNNWPTDLGAPYDDINGNNRYNPVIYGDELNWMIMNDLDSVTARESHQNQNQEHKNDEANQDH